jgi:hypothetical protein
MSAFGSRPDGENWDKREEAASSGISGASEKQGVEGGGCGETPKAALRPPDKRDCRNAA